MSVSSLPGEEEPEKNAKNAPNKDEATRRFSSWNFRTGNKTSAEISSEPMILLNDSLSCVLWDIIVIVVFISDNDSVTSLSKITA